MVPEHRKMVGLPADVIGPLDLGRLIREVTAIDEALLQAELRDSGKQPTQLPKTSKLLDESVQLNSVNLLDAGDRKTFRLFLEAIKKKAPTIHVSFSSDPSPIFVEKLTTWLRDQIHPLALMTVGLQPGIGAGCVIRTTNKYFDFSLGSHLEKKSDVLMKSLRGQLNKPGLEEALAAPETPTAPTAPATSVPAPAAAIPVPVAAAAAPAASAAMPAPIVPLAAASVAPAAPAAPAPVPVPLVGVKS